MKKIVILGIGASMFFLGSCVESSQKYKSLQARLDSLSTVHIMQNSEMESMLADLNDISAGMQSLRDAERLLTLETINENKDNSKIQTAIESAEKKTYRLLPRRSLLIKNRFPNSKVRIKASRPSLRD